MKTSYLITGIIVIIIIVAGGLWYTQMAAAPTSSSQEQTIPAIDQTQSSSADQTGQTQEQAPAPQTQNSAVPSTSTASPSAPAQAPAPQSFTVNGNDESADLTKITVPKGTSVTITFGADADGTYHGGLDFRSSVMNTGTIAPGSTKTITFVANQSFSFTPYWPSTNIAKPYKINIVVE